MRQEGGRGGEGGRRRDEARGPHFVPTLSFICGSDGGAQSGFAGCVRPTLDAGISSTFMSLCGLIAPFVVLFFCTNNNTGSQTRYEKLCFAAR